MRKNKVNENLKVRSKSKSKKNTKVITSSVLKITTLFVIVAIVAMLYQNSMTNNILADNNRQRGQEKLETVKGSKLKIGDYVNYDHTLQVDSNTKETISVPKEKLKYTSAKGDLDNSGNGKETQTVDVSGYKTKWRVYDIQGNQVLLMPETQPTAEIKGKSALAFLWYEKEMHNIAGLYGHGYGADETKQFNYEVGSRIPSEKDTRTEAKTGTGARPMLLKDIEDAYGITTNEQRQKLSDQDWNKSYPVGSNKLENAIYYATLNKTNARDKEEKIDSYATGDIGVSKTKKKLTDIINEDYYINKLDKVHTKTYDSKTGKDIQKEIIHKYWNTLGSRSFAVYSSNVDFSRGYVNADDFDSASSYFGYGNSSYFSSYEYALHPRPVVFLSSANNYYKEQGTGEYATYSMIKEENTESQYPKIHNPYAVSLKNARLKGTQADRLLFESKLDAQPLAVPQTNLTRADGTKVIDNIKYTVEGLPEGITYDIAKKQVGEKEEITIQIYPKTLNIYANVLKKDIYTGAKYNYDVVLYKNGNRVTSKKLYDTSSGKVQIGSYTNKSDIIDSDGNAIKYTLDIANFNDTVRKDNTYYVNSVGVLPNTTTNSNEVVYDLNIRYLKEKYDNVELIKKLQAEIVEKNKKITTLESSNKEKDTQIASLKAKITTLEQQGTKDKAEIARLTKELNQIKTEKEAIQSNLDKVSGELKTLQTENAKTLSENAELKKQVEDLNTKITNLNSQISEKDKIIGELNTKISNLEKQLELKTAKIKELEGKVATLTKTNETNTKKISDLNNTINGLNGKIAELEKSKTTNEKEIKNLKEQLATLTQAKENLEQEKNNLSVELESTKKLLETEKEANTTNKEKIKDLEQKLKDLQAKYDSLSNTSDTCTVDAKKLQDQVSNLTKQLGNKQKEIEGLNAKIKELTNQNSEKDTKIQNLEKQIQDAKDTKTADDKTISSLKIELENIKKEKQNIQTQLDEANKKVTEFETKNKNLIANNSKISEELKQAKENITTLNNTIKEKDAKITELGTSISNLKKEIEQKNNKITELEGKVTELETKEKTNATKITELNNTIKGLNEKITELEKSKTTNEGTIKDLKEQLATLTKTKENLEQEKNNQIGRAHV